jgi:serine/threonine-protein kinase
VDPIAQTPKRIGRYTILDELATGGTAQLYVAQKDGSPEVCVLKQLLVELESHDTARKRLRREAHVTSFLDHPNIARIIDACYEDGRFLIATEYIAGRDVETIRAHLADKGLRIPPEIAVSIVLGALAGLAYAHDALGPDGRALGLVHRDLCPRNVMIGFEGQVKLIDFGLARANVGDFQTLPGMLLGTLRYMSPEQVEAKETDRRSDVYSMGAVLFELLTGAPLIQHTVPIEILYHVLRTPAPSASGIDPTLPKALDAVLSRALAKTPDDRFQSAGEMAQALVDAMHPIEPVEPSALGEFVEHVFPNGRARANAIIEEASRRNEPPDRFVITKSEYSPRDRDGEHDVLEATTAPLGPDFEREKTEPDLENETVLKDSDQTISRDTKMLPAPRSRAPIAFGILAACTTALAVAVVAMDRDDTSRTIEPPLESRATLESPTPHAAALNVPEASVHPPPEPRRESTTDVAPVAKRSHPAMRTRGKRSKHAAAQPGSGSGASESDVAAPELAGLEKNIASLRRDFRAALFAETCQAMLAEAGRLPEEKSQTVTRDVDRALRSNDPETQLHLLSNALAKLKAAL